ncbi:MAG: hypothetical protein KGH73_12800 [Xanthomonadaceae bacterium]|nr:hypothetical protein [Xanthomonadaceae bacterium]
MASTPPRSRSERNPRASEGLETLPAAWRRLLSGHPAGPERAAGEVLGFLFELAPEELGPAARLDVAPVLLTAQPHGRYARAQPLDGRRLAQAGLPPVEQRLAASVFGLPQVPRKGRSYARLAGGVGDALLTEMLDVAPCLLGGVAGLRLARGRGHALVWAWQVEADGRQRLLPVLPRGQRLLRVGGLWYLDPERAEIGPLEGGTDDAVLLDAPPLPAESSAAMALALPRSALAQRVPLPRVFGAPERAAIPPKPVLTLHALSRHARLAAGTPPLAYARLNFEYAGELLPGRGGEGLVRRVRSASQRAGVLTSRAPA